MSYLSSTISVALHTLRELQDKANQLKANSTLDRTNARQIINLINLHCNKTENWVQTWSSSTRTKDEKEQFQEFIAQEQPLKYTLEVASISAELEALLTETLVATTDSSAASIVKTEITPITPPSVNSTAWAITRLPFETLPTFNGDPSKWTFFESSFKTMVESQNGTKVQMLNILMQHLAGEALHAVSHYGLEEANYDVVWNILRTKYADQSDHYIRLLDDITHQRGLSDIESARRTLSAVTQLSTMQADCKTIAYLVQGSLPIFAFKKWKSKFHTNHPQTLTEIVKCLEEAIAQKESEQKQHIRRNQQLPRHTPEHYTRNSKITRVYSTAKSPSSVSTEASQGSLSKQTLSTPRKLKCIFCSNNHWSNMCDRITNIQQRVDIIKQQKRCYKCLGNHFVKDCKTRRTCRNCGKPHHPAICTSTANTSTQVTNITSSVPLSNAVVSTGENNPLPTDPAIVSPLAIANVTDWNHRNPPQYISILRCVHVNLRTPDEYAHREHRHLNVPVMFDTGAQHTFIADWILQVLPCIVIEKEKDIYLSTFGKLSADRHRSTKVAVTLETTDGQNIRIIAYSIPRLVKSLHWIDPSNLPSTFVTDRVLRVPLTKIKPALIIGNDYFDRIVTNSSNLLPSGFRMHHSRLGSFLAGWGRVHDGAQSVKCSATSVIAASVSSDIDIDQFWRLENAGLEEVGKQTLNEYAQEKFTDSVKRLKDGRYEVALPWREKIDEVPENFGIAFGRLKSLFRSLQGKGTEILEKYNELFEKQLKSKIIEEVEDWRQKDFRVSYLPHHPVVTPKKIRVVYDASAHETGKPSVNDILLKGPTILNDLTGIALRARTYENILVADIEKAFHQLELQQSDRDITRFLWLRNVKGECNISNLRTFRFCRVPFGLISSPFLLGATIKHHFENSDLEYKRELLENIYVDNVLVPYTTKEDAAIKYKELKDRFEAIKMNLTGFVTSCKSVTSVIPVEDRLDTNGSTKLLGIDWNLREDKINITLDRPSFGINTKRLLLQFIARQFDPLGLIGPALIPLKNFLKEIWKSKLEWDSCWSREISDEFFKITKKWPKSTIMQVPRNGFRLPPNGKKAIVHIFVDASKVAYCACFYLSWTENSDFSPWLLFAKCRLLPNSATTIPRAELLAVSLGYKLYKYLSIQIKWIPHRAILWTDATCVLGWIRKKTKLVKQRFEQNRLEVLRSFTGEFRYVPTDQNPADLGSRGVDPQVLRTSSLWWSGPTFIRRPETAWPGMPDEPSSTICQVNTLISQDDPEDTSAMIPATFFDDSLQFMSENHISKFSKLSKLVRTVAQVLRFVDRLRGKGSKETWLSVDNISVEELARAHTIVFALAQLSITDTSVQKYDLQTGEEDELLRYSGRFPPALIFLPHDHHITELVVLDRHWTLQHASPATVVASLMQEFWIPRLYSLVKTIVKHKCMVCRRTSAKSFALPKMGDLPHARWTRSLPFRHVGVDFTGPIWVSGDQRQEKRWIFLATCFSTRAIHLELTYDLSTHSVLLCYRKLAALYGTPASIYSDNARSFILAKRVLDSIRRHLCTMGTMWKFITQYAPWKGGFYERMIGLMKPALRKVLSGKIVNDRELETILYEVAMIVNQRPLGPLKAGDISVVRPCDLLMRPNIHFLDVRDHRITWPQTTNEAVHLWQSNQVILDDFWTLWYAKYVAILNTGPIEHHLSKKGKVTNPKVGDIVLVGSKAPRQVWKLARIVEKFFSSDGLCRTVKVTLPGNPPKETVRPINLLYPLELESSNRVI